MAKPGSQRNPTIEALKDRIARDPLSRAFLQLAEEYRKEGRFQDAVQVCLEGLQRHPTYHTARISLGRTYMEGGDLENARRTFVEVLELQPENHLAAKLLGEIQKKLGDLAGAAATYRAILSFYPGDREVATLLEEALRTGTAPPARQDAAPARPPSTTPPAVAAPPQPPRPAAPNVAWVDAREPARAAAGPSGDPAPDFRAEDFGGTAVPIAREAWSPPAVAPPASWPAPSAASAGPPPGDDDALQTNTLAELYLRQGLVDRAIEVYRGMLRVDPDNRKAARRLRELAPADIRPSAMPEAPVQAADFAVPPTPRTVVETPMAPPPATNVEHDRKRDRIRRLERWLQNFSGPAAKGAPLR